MKATHAMTDRWQRAGFAAAFADYHEWEAERRQLVADFPADCHWGETGNGSPYFNVGVWEKVALLRDFYRNGF